MRRSIMFLPGNSPSMIMNGAILGADSIILDLEDAVAPDQKDAARELVRNALLSLDFGKCEIIIRINDIETPYWEKDLEELVPLHPAAVLPTKVSDAEYIRVFSAKLRQVEADNGIEPGTTGIMPLLESAAGIENAYEIAKASESIIGLALGAEDLTADLRCKRTKEGNEILYSRGKIVSSARAAGVEVYDTPFTDVEDMDGLEEDAAFAKALGFSGKLVISPRHIDTINRIFSPTREDILYAKEVFRVIEEGKKQGKGAVSLHGKMIDKPIVQRARLVLEAAEEIGGLTDE